MTTFLGIIIGSGLLFYAIVMQGGVEIFWSESGAMIVFGGTFAALLISYPLPRIIKVTGVLLQIFKKELQGPGWVIHLMVELAYKARQKSLLSLEEEIPKIENRFVKMGLEMVIDGQPAAMIREVLDTELDSTQIRHRGGEHIFRAAARFAPSFGLIGTLIGLVSMLRSIGGDGTARLLGQGMAVALITTFYGAMAANLFFTPIAEKLRARSDEEMLWNRIIIEGVLLIQGGVNPRIIETKLNSFLPPEMRRSYYEDILKASRKQALQNENS